MEESTGRWPSRGIARVELGWAAHICFNEDMENRKAVEECLLISGADISALAAELLTCYELRDLL